MPSTISYFWKSPNISKGYRTGVSLHSHTNHSIEDLSFIGRLSERFSPLKVAPRSAKSSRRFVWYPHEPWRRLLDSSAESKSGIRS